MENELVLELKPKFDLITANEIFKTKFCPAGIKILQYIVRIVVLLICLGMFGAVLYNFNRLKSILSDLLVIADDFANIILIAIIISLVSSFIIGTVAVIFISNYSRKAMYEGITYKIYNDRIEFIEDYPVERQRTLKFSNIADIELFQTNYQKNHNFGTLFFKLKEKNENQISAEQIFVNDDFLFANIENPKFVFAKLKELTNG